MRTSLTVGAIASVLGAGTASGVLLSLRSQRDAAGVESRTHVATPDADPPVADEPERPTLTTPTMVPRAQPAALRSPETPEDPGGTQAAAPELPAMRIARIHEQYEAAFVSDHGDAQWETGAKRLAMEKLPSLLPEGSTVRSFECRATMCRLETHHRDHESYWGFIKAAFMDQTGQLWNGATYSTPLKDNPDDGLMVTYIAREGQPLPQVSE
jgi:hypothetical protein